MNTATAIHHYKPFYSAKEAAEVLMVHPYTLRRWVRLGKINAVRVGGRAIRIPASAIFKAGAVPSANDHFCN